MPNGGLNSDSWWTDCDEEKKSGPYIQCQCALFLGWAGSFTEASVSETQNGVS